MDHVTPLKTFLSRKKREFLQFFFFIKNRPTFDSFRNIYIYIKISVTKIETFVVNKNKA